MLLFERCSDQARRALSLAGEEAHRLGHDFIGTEHLLLGLIAQAGTVASKVLSEAGADIAMARSEVALAVGRPAAQGPSARATSLPYTARARRALELALRESLRMSSAAIDSEHLLLGLLADGGGVAGLVLSKLGAEPAGLRSVLVDQLAPKGSETHSPHARAGGPLGTAASDTGELEEADAHLEHTEATCPGCGSPITRVVLRSIPAEGAGRALELCGACCPSCSRLLAVLP